MKFQILTLFPEMVMQGLNCSIIGRAVEKKIIALNAVNIRDYTLDKHGKVDDYPYGGGAGMLMQAQPVFDAWRAVTAQGNAAGKKPRTIYMTPQGKPFTQSLAKEFAKEEELVILCGHYEGIDERVLEEIVTDYVSIGDYVLTGGELPAMVMIDSIARLVPRVLNNDVSAETESFHNDLLEYPQYSRPEEWHGKSVPEVLLTGNHKLITQWRTEQAKERTKRIRPDLYEKYEQKERVIKFLSKQKRTNIHMMECLRRGRGEILYLQGENVVIFDRDANICMLHAKDLEGGQKLLEYLPENARYYVVVQEFMTELVAKARNVQISDVCAQGCYTKNEPLPVKHKDIRPLTMEHFEYVSSHYGVDNGVDNREYVKERILHKVMYGAFVEDKLVGFIGSHEEGSMGLLYVEETYRKEGIGASLEAFEINLQRSLGFTPYCHIIDGNEKSLRLQEKLGLYLSDKTLWWLK